MVPTASQCAQNTFKHFYGHRHCVWLDLKPANISLANEFIYFPINFINQFHRHIAIVSLANEIIIYINYVWPYYSWLAISRFNHFHFSCAIKISQDTRSDARDDSTYKTHAHCCFHCEYIQSPNYDGVRTKMRTDANFIFIQSAKCSSSSSSAEF